jgi:hypothetical protein
MRARITVLLPVIFAIGCAQYNVSKFTASGSNRVNLPVIHVSVDQESFRYAYATLMSGVVMDTSGVVHATKVEYRINCANDAISIVNSFLGLDYLSSSDSEDTLALEGLTVRATSAKQSTNSAWLLPMFATLTLSAALGVPYMSETAEIQMQMVIRDRSGAEIATLSSTGKGKAYNALYWGYYGGDGECSGGGWVPSVNDCWYRTRAANARAVRQAMVSLMSQFRLVAKDIDAKLAEPSRSNGVE